MAISMPWSHFFMGLSSFVLLLNWLAEWNWMEKWKRMVENRQGLVFAGLFVVCLLGLIKADDGGRAFSFLLDKIPLLFIPLIIITSQTVSKKEMAWVVNGFILSTVYGCFGALAYWATHAVSDMREISQFIDHIRFSLCIVLSVVFCVQIVVRGQYRSNLPKWVYVVVIVFLVGYLLVAQTLTGIVILFVLTLLYMLYLLVKMPKGRLRKPLLYLITIGLLGGVAYVTMITVQYFHDNDKVIEDRQTALGNPYEFDEGSLLENGHRIGYYVCKSELKTAWAMRSDSAYTELRENTLLRYLNSKGMRKDYAAVMALSEQEVRFVENNVANAAYTKRFGLRRALYQTFFSLSLYRKYGTIDDSSLMQRVELWSASCRVIGENWLLGVGMGDHKLALDSQLAKQNSPIADRHNRGSHSQYLTFWLMGGILLLLYFLFVIVYPFVKMRPRITLVYMAFILMIVLSCLAEDTLETQTGRMLFSVFAPLLLYGEK